LIVWITQIYVISRVKHYFVIIDIFSNMFIATEFCNSDSV